MTQSGRRFATETEDLEQEFRTPARGLVQATDVDPVDSDDTATPFRRRRKRVALLLAPMLALGVAGTAFAVTGATDTPIEAAPVAAAAAPSQAPSRDAGLNRGAQRPSITASSLPATSAAPSSTAPSTSAAPSTTAAKPSPTKAATTTAKPKPTTAALGEVVGTRYTVAGINVRSAASIDAEVIGSLPDDSKVSITSVTLNGFAQINWDGRAAYVSADYLTRTKPAAPTTSTQTSSTKSSSAGSSSGGAISGAACSKSSGIESGLTSNAIKVYRAICANFPAVSSFGGYRPSADFHGSGQAVDAMVTGAAGWEVANWVRANASALGVTEVIYSQRIWTTQRAGEGWRSMSDRGSTTANHYDHVHVSVR